MTLGEKQQLSIFLQRTEEGKLLKELFVDTLVNYTDLRNIKDNEDPRVVQKALDMFTVWVEDIFGAADDYEFHAETVIRKRKLMEGYIYQTKE